MKVKYKNGLMSYEVKGETESHYDLSMVGLVPKDKLEPYDESEGIPDIVDVYLELQK